MTILNVLKLSAIIATLNFFILSQNAMAFTMTIDVVNETFTFSGLVTANNRAKLQGGFGQITTVIGQSDPRRTLFDADEGFNLFVEPTHNHYFIFLEDTNGSGSADNLAINIDTSQTVTYGSDMPISYSGILSSDDVRFFNDLPSSLDSFGNMAPSSMSIVVVPEPSTYAILLSASSLLMVILRHRS